MITGFKLAILGNTSPRHPEEGSGEGFKRPRFVVIKQEFLARLGMIMIV